MELDMEKIRTHIQFLTHDLNILELNKEILQAEIKLAEELAPLEKAEIDRFENYVKKTSIATKIFTFHLIRSQQILI